MALKAFESDFIASGKTGLDSDFITQGRIHRSRDSVFILRGRAGASKDGSFVTKGKTGLDSGFVLDTKKQSELAFILNAINLPESLVAYSFTQDEIEDLEMSAGEIVNEITLNFAWDFVEDKAKGSITKHNPLSKLLYGDAPKTVDLRLIQNARQVDIIADAFLKTGAIPPVNVAFRHSMKSFPVEVGDIVGLSHEAGIGENGFMRRPGLVTKKTMGRVSIAYEVLLKAEGNLFRSELLTLTQVSGTGQQSFNVTYENGVATITVYADVQGSPPVEGAEVTINGVKKITDKKGQVRFPLAPGRYVARIEASGYELAEIAFSV